LRVVEDRCFERVGSNEVRQCKARLVVASNQSLHDLVEEGEFRADLYHRLNVVAFSVPPLRERSEEIPRLAEVFLGKYSEEFQLKPPVLSEEVSAALQQYSWPGNVRELRNAIERVVALVPEGGTAQIKDLPSLIVDFVESGGILPRLRGAERANGNRLAEARHDAERQRLQEAIRRNNNNRSQAASELGISRVTLYKKMHKYGLI
jgi:transcriptional regulator with PAS, ATPase and Fis domain